MLEELIKKQTVKHGIDFSYLIKNSLANSVTFIIKTIVAIGIGAILARMLTVEDFGLYQQLFLTASLLLIFLFPGINQNLIISLIKGKNKTIHRAIYLKVQGIFLAIAILLAYNSLFTNSNNTLTGLQSPFHPLLIAVMMLLITNVLTLYKTGYTAKKQFTKLSKINCLLEICKLIAVIIALFFTKNYINIILVITTITLTVNIIPAILEYKEWKIKNTEEDMGFSKATYKTSGIIGWSLILDKLDYILTVFLYGPAVLAIYVVASTFSDAMKTYQGNITNIYFPKIVEYEDEVIRKKIKTNILKITATISIICLLLLISIPLMIYVIYGSKYTNSIPAAEILIISIIPFGILLIINQFYNAKRYYKYIYLNITISMSSKIIFLAFLHKFGLIGLAIANTLSVYITCIIAVMIFIKTKKFQGSPTIAIN